MSIDPEIQIYSPHHMNNNVIISILSTFGITINVQQLYINMKLSSRLHL